MIDLVKGSNDQMYLINVKSFHLENDNFNQLIITTPQTRFLNLKNLFKEANITCTYNKQIVNFVDVIL